MTEFSDRKIIVNKKDTVWNWAFNTPCKSLKGILVLFEEEGSYTQDTSKIYNPKIQKVSVIVEGKPNQLCAQGMRSFEQYDEICKYFTERKQRDNDANGIQKHLQLYDLSLGEYLVNKFALWLDFRTIDENKLHGTGRHIENASEGITLEILNHTLRRNRRPTSLRWIKSFLYYKMDKKSIVNDLYQAAVISVLAVGYSMLGKKILKMTPPSIQKFDLEDMRKLVAIVAASEMTREYLVKQKILPDHINV